MATDSEDMKKELERIAGREIHADAELLKFLWYPAGAYDYRDGSVASQSIILPGVRCTNARLLDASGGSKTGADGKRVFRR